jgi:hypothetical protein
MCTFNFLAFKCMRSVVSNRNPTLSRTSLSKYREAGLPDDHMLVACTLGNIEMAENAATR